MPRINALESHDVDATTAATLEGVAKQIGMVPNLLGTLAQAPAALHGYLALSEQLGKGQLSSQQREMIALTIAQFNRCQYCLSAHSLMAKGAGLSPDAVVRARQGSAKEPLDNSLVAFARAVAQNRGVLGRAEFEAFAAQGLSPALMVEVVALVVLNQLTNYVNHLAETEIDFPVVELEAAA